MLSWQLHDFVTKWSFSHRHDGSYISSWQNVRVLSLTFWHLSGLGIFVMTGFWRCDEETLRSPWPSLSRQIHDGFLTKPQREFQGLPWPTLLWQAHDGFLTKPTRELSTLPDLGRHDGFLMSSWRKLTKTSAHVKAWFVMTATWQHGKGKYTEPFEHHIFHTKFLWYENNNRTSFDTLNMANFYKLTISFNFILMPTSKSSH